MLKRTKYKKMANKSGRNFCDELWAVSVKTRDGYKCAVCGDTNMPNAHHLITRKVFKYRWNVDNGITLCPKHHEFDVSFSAHTAPWALEYWMKDNRPKQYANHVTQRNSIDNVKTEYQEIYFRLEHEFKEATGEFHKIARLQHYIMFKNVEDINALHLHEDKTFTEIADKYGVSKNAMKKFMTDNKIL
jgi:5-methylcytosine-specific restriction endonuclease McrA